MIRAITESDRPIDVIAYVTEQVARGAEAIAVVIVMPDRSISIKQFGDCALADIAMGGQKLTAQAVEQAFTEQET